MICPSSSDEESDIENIEEDIISSSVTGNGSFHKSHARSASKASSFASVAENSQTSLRVPSPTSSVASEEAEARARQHEEEEHRMRLQLYVFVIRCIAYPFVAKQPTDLVKRQVKVNKSQLQQLKERFSSFLAGETHIAADEAFINAVTSYYEVFLNSDRLQRMVQGGGCSAKDLRDVFKNNIDKRVKNLPEIDGLSKETVLSSWMAKFDAIYRGDEDSRRMGISLSNLGLSEVILSKEQLYEMYQTILGIKKFEHQLLFNACQLDNADEQAAAIRRELNGRLKAADKIEAQRRFPKFFNQLEAQSTTEMQKRYSEELRKQVNVLMGNLEGLPVSTRMSNGRSSYSMQKFRKLQNSAALSLIDHQNEEEGSLSKSDVTLQFTLEIVVSEVQGLRSLSGNKTVYCTMEVLGGDKLQTDHAEASKPVWDTQGDFVTTNPLPVVKVKLFTESTSVLSIDDKELGKVILHPKPNSPKTSEWYEMTVPKNIPDQLRIKLAIRMDRPPTMKHCGYLWAQGRSVWKKWKKRYFILVQASQYNFAMCSYQEKKTEPNEMMQLDGFTVDYTVPEIGHEGGSAFFNAVKEGDSVTFASDDEQDRILWVQAMYRATGQTHKPVPPTHVQKLSAGKHGQLDAPVSQFYADHARKHGMDEFISADPCKYDHAGLFELLQRLTLDHRLNDSYSCLGWFSPGQIFVLDEYCARYGVRGCHRHLCFLKDLLDRAEHGMMIDPTLMHYSHSFCLTHVCGGKIMPDGTMTITLDEKERCDLIESRLHNYLKRQITHFRYCFPFGRPKGGLKSTLAFLGRVLKGDCVGTAGDDVMKPVICKCLHDAALVNYERVSDYAKVEETLELDPTVRLKIIINLAEMCIDVLQQNKEYHYESFAWFTDEMIEHAEIFLSLFSVDMDSVLEKQPPDTWNSFPLFQILNDFLLKDDQLRNGKFHHKLRDTFAPMVVRYIDLMESSVAQTIHRGFAKNGPDANSLSAINVVNDVLWKLDALQSFVHDLHWPDQIFGAHIGHRLKLTASDMIQSVVTRTLQRYNSILDSCRVTLDFVIPDKICSLINVAVECRNRCVKLCASGLDASGTQHLYHIEVDKVLQEAFDQMSGLVISKFDKGMELVLNKLARFDEGTFTASLLTLTKPSMELANNYVYFVRNNQDVIRDRINDDTFVEFLFTKWYQSGTSMLKLWLSDRSDLQLHLHQLKTLIKVFKQFYRDFELHGVANVKDPTYDYIFKRLTVEEATAAVTVGPLGPDTTMSEMEQEHDDMEAS